MQAFIGATLLTSKETQPQSKPFEIYDSRLPGFTLRVQPSGVRSYYARFGRNRRVVLGKVGTLAPEEARERCQKVLETSRMLAIRCTVLGEQMESRSEGSSQTRIRGGSKRAVHELLPTRSRSYIGSLEPGTQNHSRPLRLSASNRGRHDV